MVERRRSCMSSSVEDHWCCLRRTLVTLCEQPKCVNLAHKVCNARPPTKSKPNHEHPHHHKHIDRVRPDPPSEKSRWPFHCILQITTVHQNLISQKLMEKKNISQANTVIQKESNKHYFLGPFCRLLVIACRTYNVSIS